MNEGQWLRAAVAGTGMSVTEFARKVGVSRDALNKWFRQSRLLIRPDLLVIVLRALGYSDREVMRAQMLADVKLTTGDDSQQDLVRKIMSQIRDVDASREAEFNDRSVEPYSEKQVPGEIPTFDMSVAAGPWADVTDIAEVFHPGQIDHGLFRIRIAGESMTPTYKSGMVIEFQCLREGRDRLMIGEDYYVQKRDGTATFKRLKEVHEDRLVLFALNQRSCKGTMSVERGEIVRMAIALHEIRMVK